jgi:hypothetical protein
VPLTQREQALRNLILSTGGGGSAPDASTTVKGIVQLAGDLAGTATSPTVPGLAGKADTVHTHTAADISDSTATGRSVLTAVSAAAARTAIGAGTSSLALGTTSSTAKAGDYQPAAANISDSTTVGRAVLTAVDAAAARTAIGAGTSSLALGTTSSTAKAGDYQPTAANISDSTTVGRAVLTAADAAAARTAIGAGTSSLAIGTTSSTAASGDRGLPTGGTSGQVLAKSSATDYAVGWVDRVVTTRQVIAGTGLTGGGDLSADRTLTVAYGSASGTAVQGNDARVTADQAAGTASIRTIGTGALQAAAGNHTHTDKVGAMTIVMVGGNAGATWTSMPAALTEFNGNIRTRVKTDLTDYTQAQITAAIGTAGSVNAELRIQYATDGDTQATWAYLDNTSGPLVNIGSGAGAGKAGSFVTLVAGAKAAVWLRVVGINGNGTASPFVGNVAVTFK